jgi:cytidyltransferase-like protein
MAGLLDRPPVEVIIPVEDWDQWNSLLMHSSITHDFPKYFVPFEKVIHRYIYLSGYVGSDEDRIPNFSQVKALEPYAMEMPATAAFNIARKLEQSEHYQDSAIRNFAKEIKRQLGMPVIRHATTVKKKPTFDEAVFEAISGIATYGKVQGVSNDRGGGAPNGFGGPRNRGVPGYPVPPAMKASTTSEPSLEEAADPGKLHKTIPHLDDLKPEEFLVFLHKYATLPIQGGLEISEKVDGSARITFGVDQMGLWTQTKNSGVKRYHAADYPQSSMFDGIRAAHAALETHGDQITQAWPQGVSFFVAEVLYTRIPNSIEYGPNMIIVHGVHDELGAPLDEMAAKDAAKSVTDSVPRLDGDEPWRLEYKRVIPHQDFLVDVKLEFKTLGQIYKHLKELEPNKRRAGGKEEYQRQLEQFQGVQKQVKDKLVSQLRQMKSAYGPDGGDIEGLVFRDPKNGSLVKLVDKDYFTKLNKFLWHYRELLEKGIKIGDRWEFGVLQALRNEVGDRVIGDSTAKTPSFLPNLQKFGLSQGTTNPDDLLSAYIQKKGLLQGDYIERFKEAVGRSRQAFEQLQAEWNAKKSGELSVDIYGKRRAMDPLIKDRTDQAFVMAKNTLDGMQSALEQLPNLKDDAERKLGVMKMFLGNRYEKLGMKTEVIRRGTGTTDLSGKKLDNEDPVSEVVRNTLSRIVTESSGGAIGVTIGRFQPFHAGHATIIRNLATQFQKVVVFIAGQKQSRDNPFSHEIRLKMMEASLPDVWSKIEVYPAMVAGKGTGYLPGLIATVAKSGASSIKPGSRVSVLVGEDRIQSVQTQIQHNEAHRGQPGYFTGQISVDVIAGVKNDDDAERISGTRVREALQDDEKEDARNMLDPHLQDRFEEFYAALRKEMGKTGAVTGKRIMDSVIEAIIQEVGMGALETGPGFTRGGAWGSSGWSRAILSKDTQGDETYQQFLASPSNRMLPFKMGQEDPTLPGVDALDNDPDEENLNKPTDLGEMIQRIVRRKLDK